MNFLYAMLLVQLLLAPVVLSLHSADGQELGHAFFDESHVAFAPMEKRRRRRFSKLKGALLGAGAGLATAVAINAFSKKKNKSG